MADLTELVTAFGLLFDFHFDFITTQSQIFSCLWIILDIVDLKFDQSFLLYIFVTLECYITSILMNSDMFFMSPNWKLHSTSKGLEWSRNWIRIVIKPQFRLEFSFLIYCLRNVSDLFLDLFWLPLDFNEKSPQL